MKVFDDIKPRDIIYVVTMSGDVIECDVIREGNKLLLSDDSYEVKELDITNCLNNFCIILADNSVIVLDIKNLLKCINHIKNTFKEMLCKLEQYETIYKEKQI